MGAEDPAGSKGLLKWKGVMFAPDDGIDKNENEGKAGKDTTDSAAPGEELEQGTEVSFLLSIISTRSSSSLLSAGVHGRADTWMEQPAWVQFATGRKSHGYIGGAS